MDARRSIPSVEKLLASPSFAALCASEPRDLVVHAVRIVLDEIREQAIDASGLDETAYAQRATACLSVMRAPSLKPVINATGVILHTNLGRAPLAQEAIDAMRAVAGGYSTLEYDAASGRRGSRYVHCASLLRHLTGAEDALVVNNNAAALVLALNTLSRNRTAIVSRGELVEIGGSFRVPDIMKRSGVKLVEVGSTNRTHLQDYVDAIDARTGVLLKVHPSNFTIEGYTADVSLEDLVAEGNARDVPVVYDLGSGLLDHAAFFGLPNEPTARDCVNAGAVVTMSGDKLLGGPQAGIILGSRAQIAAMQKNPLCRAMRVDKLTLSALWATLVLHLDRTSARDRVPILHMITATPDDLAQRATSLASALQAAGVHAETIAGSSSVGGGAAPGAQLPTTLVSIKSATFTSTRLEAALRTAQTPVIARIGDDAVLIDVRTVLPHQTDDLTAALIDACNRSPKRRSSE